MMNTCNVVGYKVFVTALAKGASEKLVALVPHICDGVNNGVA